MTQRLDPLSPSRNAGKLVSARKENLPFTLLALDRDGTVIEHVPYLNDPERVRLLPTVAETIEAVNALGIPVVIVTNQSGVSRGFYSEREVTQVNMKMIDSLSEAGAHITAVYVCYHGPEQACECRKPRPGMLLQAIEDFGTTAQETLFVGDNSTDGLAATAAGARFVGVCTGVEREGVRVNSSWMWVTTLHQAVFPGSIR